MKTLPRQIMSKLLKTSVKEKIVRAARVGHKEKTRLWEGVFLPDLVLCLSLRGEVVHPSHMIKCIKDISRM